MKNWDRRLFFVLLSILVVNLVVFVWQNREVYLAKFDIPRYEEVYKYSQYNVPKNEFRGAIDDPELYSLAGYHYIHGDDPTEINFEQQPLAKYFFGLSILLFGNAVVAQLAFGVTALFLTYRLAKLVLGSGFLAVLPSVFLSFDLLFKEQISRVYLDLFLTVAVLMFFLTFLISLSKPRLIPMVFVLLGVVGLAKTYFFIPVAALAPVIYLFVFERKKLLSYFYQSYWLAAAYLAGYFVYFLKHQPWDFFDLHLRTLKLYKSYVPEYPKGEVFRIIFTGTWRKWFADFGLMKVNTWSWLWPLGTAGVVGSGITLLSKIDRVVVLLFLWCLVYIGTVAMKLVFPRYLLPVLPAFYILLVYFGYTLLRRLDHGYRN